MNSPSLGDSSTSWNDQQTRIAQALDSTLLTPGADESAIEALCLEAAQCQFFAVCVRAHHIEVAKRHLSGSSVRTCAVIGFPEGTQSSNKKCEEAEDALALGADELDMVLNLDLFLQGDPSSMEKARRDIEMVRHIVPRPAHRLKVIIETGILTNPQKKVAATIVMDAGADFVKTCSGFRPGKATPEDVGLLKSVCGDAILIKASGGIKTFHDALALLNAGASRLGSSAGAAIIRGI